MKLTIGYLYGDLMNIYGDTGNIIALQKRCQWRGIEVKVINISIGDNLKSGECNLYFFGGGQDQSQIAVSKDLTNSSKGKDLKNEVERGVPLLSICGGYQLLGEYYLPQKGSKLPGIGLFDAYTIASNDRMIGNIIVENNILSALDNWQKSKPAKYQLPNTKYQLVGFENHSGKTYLKPGAKPLGKVIKGFGNNGEDQTEGCIYKNSIGCYMHGSLLPKNPQLADWLIQKALEIKYNRKIELEPLDDTLETQAHDKIIQRFG